MALPFATFERILKEAKKGIRVSDKATLAFAAAIESLAKEIAAEASSFAEHANRKTIMEQDIRMALKVLGKKRE